MTFNSAFVVRHLYFDTSLGSNHRSIASASGTPAVVEVTGTAREWKFLCQLFVNLDAMTRNFVGVKEAVFGLGTSLKDLGGFLRKSPALMDAEIVAGQLKRQLSRMSNRRSVARAVPR